MTDIKPEHFLWALDDDGVASVTLNRPEKKNPLTFESYAELRDTFRSLVGNNEVKAVIISGAGDNFCSGGDVHEIIGPLTKMDMKDLLRFTRMTGDLVKAIRNCPQPVTSAIDGICAGAGAAHNATEIPNRNTPHGGTHLGRRVEESQARPPPGDVR